VTKPSNTYNSGKGRATNPLGRTEPITDDERPFAEIRRTLTDVLRMLILHRWMFFVPFCLVASGAFIASLYYPRTYSASTTFERRNDPVMMNLPMSAGAASFKYFRNTMVRDLTSIETVGEVVEQLALIPDLEKNPDGSLTDRAKRRRDSLARALGATLEISTTSPSELIDVIKITYTGSDPQNGSRLVDAVKKSYVRRTMSWIHDFLTSQRDYFRQEASEAMKEVNDAQRVETEMRLASPYADPSDPSSIALKLSQLELERRELLMRKREYDAELGAQRQMLAAIEPELPAVVGPPTPSDATPLSPVNAASLRVGAQVFAIDREINNLRESRGMTDEHPAIQELLAGRRRLLTDFGGGSSENALALSHAPVPAPAGTDHASRATADAAQADRARLLVQIAAQESKLKDVEISLQTTEEALAQVRTAKDEVGHKQEEFAEVTGRVERAREVHSRLERTVAEIEPAIKAIEQDRLLQFSEGQAARGSNIPISPKAATIVLLALAAGLAAGALFVILAELIDHVYRSSGQVARSLGLPMLEAIDEIVTAQDRRRLFVRRAVVMPVLLVGFVGFTGLAGSLAYCSIAQPWTYQKLRKIPAAALELFIETTPQTTIG